METIAAELSMSAATFKRHLKDEGVTYRGLKNKVRFKLSRKWLLVPQSQEAIAQQLGFSDVSNFIKAFKQWSGTTSKAFLEHQASDCLRLKNEVR